MIAFLYQRSITPLALCKADAATAPAPWSVGCTHTEEMDEQVVVVTGASSGVGRAIARAFGRRRARVALLARNEEALTNAAREVEDDGGSSFVCALDVADAVAV